MSQGYDFYAERADACAAEAEAAQLENVKVRALRSEKAWRTLATRARQVQTNREANADAKREAVTMDTIPAAASLAS